MKSVLEGSNLLSLRYERSVEIELHDHEQHEEQHEMRLLAGALHRLGSSLPDSHDIARTIWSGLLEGDWVLVDAFVQYDRCFFVTHKREKRARRTALTTREREVLELTLRGHSNKFAAIELGMTTSTVATHLRRAMRKLGLDSRAALLQLAPFCGPPDRE